MQLRIDVQDSAGNKLGHGPITTATQWRNVTRLDRGGEFSFTMPAADPQAALIVAKRTVWCYGLVGGVMTLLGSGIIDQIDVQADTNPTMLTVSGPDLSGELAYRTCGTLSLSQAGYASPDDAHKLHISPTSGQMIDGSGNPTNDPTAAGYQAFVGAIDGNAGTSVLMGGFDSFHRWYLGYSLTYGEVKFVFATPCAQANASWDSIQYYSNTATVVNGVPTAGWVNLPSYVDGTVSGGKTWGQNGSITFTAPADWTPLDQNVLVGGNYQNITGYWLRFQGDDLNPPSATVAEITVNTQVPTTNGPNLALASAPSGWALDGAGHSGTAQAIQSTSQDETVLAALIKVGALCYEHFRFGSGRSVYWLQRDTPASGVRAIRTLDGQSIESNVNVAAITSLKRATDGAVITRIKPYGAGISGARLTLAKTTRDTDGVNPLPANYSLDKTNNWIINNGSGGVGGESQYGRIEVVQTWSNIGPPNDANANRAPAANALYDVALFWLQQHATPIDTYALAVTGLKASLLPGQTVRVVWKEIVDGYSILDVNADLIVLEATNQIDAAGVRTVALTVSSVPVWPMTETEVVAQAIRRLQYAYAHPQRTDIQTIHNPSGSFGGTPVYTTNVGGVYARN